MPLGVVLTIHYIAQSPPTKLVHYALQALLSARRTTIPRRHWRASLQATMKAQLLGIYPFANHVDAGLDL